MQIEQLTVRIVADSGNLRKELESLAKAIRKLSEDLDGATNQAQNLGRGFEQTSAAVISLDRLSQTLARLKTQAESLGQTPITLNVTPAMQSLEQLGGAIQRVAAQLQALNATPVTGGAGPAPAPTPAPVSPRRFAGGGVVAGPAGLDAVPALLTAGEFVLSRQATDALGTAFLGALNATATPAAAPALAAPMPQTTNHFGGITIHVAEAGGVNNIVRDLRLQGIRLRNRWG